MKNLHFVQKLFINEKKNTQTHETFQLRDIMVIGFKGDPLWVSTGNLLGYTGGMSSLTWKLTHNTIKSYLNPTKT